MNEKEIKDLREQYAPKDCESQIEFERIMAEMNADQSQRVAPLEDRERELNRQRLLIESRRLAMTQELQAIALERIDIEQKRKDINRLFYELKHELIKANPIEKFARPEEAATED